MVRLPTNVESLVDSGESADEQYELLRWARCLSARGLSDRAGVLALLRQVEREYEEANRQPGYPITGGPTLCMVQRSALASGGYLDEGACAAFDRPPGNWQMVERVVAEARAAWGRLPSAGPQSASPASHAQPGGWPGQAYPEPNRAPQVQEYPEPQARPFTELPPPAATADTIVCRICGRQLPAIARYCGYCGIRVT